MHEKDQVYHLSLFNNIKSGVREGFIQPPCCFPTRTSKDFSNVNRSHFLSPVRIFDPELKTD